jgi:hypothetical protein
MSTEEDYIPIEQAAMLYTQIMAEMARDMRSWISQRQAMVLQPRIVVKGEDGVTAVFTIDREVS